MPKWTIIATQPRVFDLDGTAATGIIPRREPRRSRRNGHFNELECECGGVGGRSIRTCGHVQTQNILSRLEGDGNENVFVEIKNEKTGLAADQVEEKNILN